MGKTIKKETAEKISKKENKEVEETSEERTKRIEATGL